MITKFPPKPFNCSSFSWNEEEKTLTIVIVNSPTTMKIEGDDAYDIMRFLNCANGYRTINEISSEIPLDLEKANLIYEFLIQEGVIFDKSNIWQWFLKVSQSRSHFALNLSNLQIQEVMSSSNHNFGKLLDTATTSVDSVISDPLQKRCSCRSFSKNFSLTKGQLFEALSVMTRFNNHWTIPSAGGLYSFVPVIILLRPVEDLESGVYYFNPRNQSLHLPRVPNNYHSSLWYERMLDDSYFASAPSAIILLTANVGRVSQKYSNRALRFCLIEAGHIAQNLMIYLAEKDLSILEYGGYDDSIADLIVGEDNLSTMTCLILGKESSSEVQVDDQLIEQIRETYPHTSNVVADSQIHGYHSPFVRVSSSLSENVEDSGNGYGTGTTFSEASLKATVEALEREVSLIPWFDIEVCANQLPGKLITPEEIYGYHESIYTQGKISRFPFDIPIKWVEGKFSKSGETIYIPMECVFYGGKAGSTYGFSSSNGVAAHTSLDRAFSSGFYELLERDAFVARYHSQTSAGKVCQKWWPQWLIQQNRQLSSLGFQVELIELTTDGPIVLLVCIWSQDQSPFFVSGTAASLEFEEACKKAFQEAEFMLTSWSPVGEKLPSIENVDTPNDHGMLYLSSSGLDKVEWLLSSSEAIQKPECNITLDDLIAKFDPCFVDLTSKKPLQVPLHVVRVVSKKLYPMYFGYGLEPFNHTRRKEVGLPWKTEYPSYPHFFS